MKKKDRSIFKKIFFSGLFFPIIIILAIFLSISFLERQNESKETYQDLESLKKEIEFLEKDNKELEQLIEYFNSNFFLEKEAREKLGLKKDGEKVVVVAEDYSQNDKNEDDAIVEKEKSQKVFLPKLWVDYFFAEK